MKRISIRLPKALGGPTRGVLDDVEQGHWVCQTCRAATGRDGIVEIINVNIDLGPVGTYPRRATQDRRIVEERFLTAKADERGVARKDLVLTALELAAIPDVTPNNAFVVRQPQVHGRPRGARVLVRHIARRYA